MKALIYISGIFGVLLLVVSSIGLFAELPNNTFILIASLVLLGLVFLPLTIVDKVKQNRKINEIIKSFEGKKDTPEKVKQGQTETKGWGMNNSPFRKRKSGLDWGGGNIKGATAQRGARRSFLK